MSVFNFTINCPVTPTPTPTPEPTPCICDAYQIENVGGAPRTVFYTDCRGILRSIPVGSGVIVEQCACDVTPQTNIIITNLGTCASAPTNTPTPTATSTPTPAATFPPTPTPLPTYTITVYARLEKVPDAKIPPGSGTEPNVRVYWWLGPVQFLSLLGGNINSTSCNLVGTITNIYEGTRINIGMRSWSYNTPVFFIPNLGSSTCLTTPGSTSYCGTAFDPGGGFSFTVTGNTTIALTARTTTVIQGYIQKTRKLNFAKLGTYQEPIYKTSLYYCNDWSPIQSGNF